MAAETYITKDGDTLDSICQGYYGRTVGIVEQVLEANVDLAERGEVLPAGVAVVLPEIAEPTTESITLW